ncbi:hypothetical protein FRC12_000890 [Ceratobasidium sp. 428]|nr:hypothetical protein FRC12_000890 [Ceratobasidium sp. 428]
MQTSAEGEGVIDDAVNATVSSITSAPAIIAILKSRRCRDITGQLDLGKCGHFPIAGGGFGDVYQGALIGGEKIAIKCARLYLQRDDISGQTLKRAARELDNWSYFEHENVLKLLGLARFRDQMAMISPWMDQGTLQQHLERNPDVDRYLLCLDISEGVAYLHQNDTIHGDIKSANVLISGEGVAKLTDFGCTKLKTSTLCFTTTTGGQALSTRWAAPERLRGGICSKEADVYALGMTLLEVVTGEVPFSDKADIAVQVAVVVDRQMPERPKEFPSFSPDGANQLWGIVIDSCAYDSSDRPGSTTIRNRLQGIIKHSRQPSPDDMIIDSISNAAVNERGQLWTLGVPSNGMDEEDNKHQKYNGDRGDSDSDESMKDAVDEEEELQRMLERSCVLLYTHNSNFNSERDLDWTFRGSPHTGGSRRDEHKLNQWLFPEWLESQSQSKGSVSKAKRTYKPRPRREYFVVFPNVYAFDTNHIVCRVDNTDRCRKVGSIKPIRPGAENVFSIDHTRYWLDREHHLWYNFDDEWHSEVTYAELPYAREAAACLLNQSLGLPSKTPVVPQPSTSGANTHRSSGHEALQDLELSLSEKDMYPPLPQRPGKSGVDTWFQEFKARREVIQEAQGRTLDIECPIENCGKPQRGPQALRDHLYLHFGIKHESYSANV